MLKKIALSTFILFFSACGLLSRAPEPFTPDFAGKFVQKDQISVYIPENWTEVDLSQTTLPKETILAYRPASPEQTNAPADQVTNLNIVKKELAEKISSLELMQSMLENYRTQLTNFQEINQKEITLVNQETQDQTLLILFSGQAIENGKSLKFLQTGLVKDKTAYLITATLPENQNEETFEITKGILQSFNLISEQEKE